jgi:hypothetical protein
MEEREKKVVPRVRGKDSDDATVEFTNVVSLKRFPPKLRKLGKYLLESENPCSIVEACKAINVNYDSIRTMIHKAKQNGNDFRLFVDEQTNSMLQIGKIGVYRALQEGAVSHSSTSHHDRKTYLQLTGDLKETVTNTSITLAIGIASSPGIIASQGAEKGVIDVEPVIPDRLK